MVFYHVTLARRVARVRRKGLVPRRRKRGSGGDDLRAIYLFNTCAEAQDAVMNWLGDEFPENEPLALLQVDLPEGFPVEVDPELSLSASR